MKTSLETRLIVDLDWEERYLNELEQMGSEEQIKLQKKAVLKAFLELSEYYLDLDYSINLKEV
jgi:hypothetical protein